MAFKLNKTQITERDQFAADLRATGETLNAAIVTYNQSVTEHGEALTEALEAYNEKLEEAREFVNTIAADTRGEFDDKSEKWREGDKGQEVQNWVETWETIDLEDFDIEIPETIEEIDSSQHAGALEELSEAPG